MLRAQCVTVVLVFCLKGSLSHLTACGRAPLNTRPVDGRSSPEGAWPWQVSLQRPGKGGGHFCGGSLINREWVLSAARCFSSRSNRKVTVHLGKQTFNGPNPHQVTRQVKTLVLHPSYNCTSKNNDIALLRLHSSVAFSDYIRPVCLAGRGSSFPDDTMSWTTGWGSVDSPASSPGALQETMAPIINAVFCQYLLNSKSITPNMICAGYLYRGPNTCQADFGGPMVTKLGAAWIQTGITSWDNGCSQRNSLGVYTLVSQYETWISRMVRGNLPGFVRYSTNQEAPSPTAAGTN